MPPKQAFGSLKRKRKANDCIQSIVNYSSDGGISRKKLLKTQVVEVILKIYNVPRQTEWISNDFYRERYVGEHEL